MEDKGNRETSRI